MAKPRISCMTPTVRPEGLEIVGRCLKRQTHQDFEWIVVSPFRVDSEIFDGLNSRWVKDPGKRDGDYYSLNQSWNKAFKVMKGELFVNIVDLLWFPPDTLEKLWFHFTYAPLICVGGVGNQYEREENGKPEGLTWVDPRTQKDKQFYEIPARDFELCLASIPTKAIYEVGGVDEEFDKMAAWSEKEMCQRISKLGYKFYLDQTLEYRALKHPRLSEDWDEKYKESTQYYFKCLREIDAGTRLRLEYLKGGES